MKDAKKIFISYRRADTRGYAHAIYNLLVQRYGAGRVFMDVDTIRPGDDFVQVLQSEINACNVLLALIGPNWLDAKDAEGRRRLDNPNDFVRMEIEAALKNGSLVIPLLLEDARMPAAPDLQGDLKALPNRQAFVIGNHLASDVTRLVQVIEGAGPAAKLPAQPSQKISWGHWFFLSLAAIPGVFFALMLVANFIWYYTVGYQQTGGQYMYIALQGVLETGTLFVYFFASEGAVSLIQWLVFLRGRNPKGGFWLISNALFGLLTGFGVDLAITNRWLINQAAANLLLAVFGLWLVYNVVLGPVILKGSSKTAR